MKLHCIQKNFATNSKIEILFDDFSDAQNYFTNYLRCDLLEKLTSTVNYRTIFAVLTHFFNEFEKINKMPYLCENEDGILLKNYDESNEISIYLCK